MLRTKNLTLTPCQKNGLAALEANQNVFITGIAGTGKSTLIQTFIKDLDPKDFPVLASTGAAALILGGRTFHSFFGLGIMAGGPEITIEKALRNRKIVSRLKKISGFILDEVSMIPGTVLNTAERIVKIARDSNAPWGGLKVIAVGDFAQLPPIAQSGYQRDWVFESSTWLRSHFKPILLETIVRTDEPRLIEALNDIREGRVSEKAAEFLNSRTVGHVNGIKNSDFDPDNFEGTRLFAHRKSTDEFNLKKLAKLPGKAIEIPSTYFGRKERLDAIKKVAPIPEVLVLKPNALVMFRQNDPIGRWINGSLGHVQEIGPKETFVQLLSTGRTVKVERFSFAMIDGDGSVLAEVTNFPLSLAYASTIHKSQGMTIDRLYADLTRLWEPGQAYVALSRVKSTEGLFLSGWTKNSIIADNKVIQYYRKLAEIDFYDIDEYERDLTI